MPDHRVLEVEHFTRYVYDSPVEVAHHLAYLRPLDAAGQRVEAFELAIEPAPMHRREDDDRLGNRRLCFTVDRPHRELTVRAKASVRVASEALPVEDSVPWEAVAERLRYAAGRAFEPASEFVHASPYVPRLAPLREWAARSFTPGRPVAAVGRELMKRIHAEFTYRSASTDVDTPLAEAFSRREGVCQDFAHLLIGALRSHGVAARYVSGYLLTHAPARGATDAPRASADAPWLGADASHAWVALWCPHSSGGSGWLELDPTNAVEPGGGHIRVAVGRDYGDVTPLRGVIRGGGEHRLDVRVRTQRVS